MPALLETSHPSISRKGLRNSIINNEYCQENALYPESCPPAEIVEWRDLHQRQSHKGNDSAEKALYEHLPCVSTVCSTT